MIVFNSRTCCKWSSHVFCICEQNTNTLGDGEDCAMTAFTEPPDLLEQKSCCIDQIVLRRTSMLMTSRMTDRKCNQKDTFLDKLEQMELGLSQFPTGCFRVTVKMEGFLLSSAVMLLGYMCCPMPFQPYSDNLTMVQSRMRLMYSFRIVSVFQPHFYCFPCLCQYFFLRSTNVFSLCYHSISNMNHFNSYMVCTVQKCM